MGFSPTSFMLLFSECDLMIYFCLYKLIIYPYSYMWSSIYLNNHIKHFGHLFYFVRFLFNRRHKFKILLVRYKRICCNWQIHLSAFKICVPFIFLSILSFFSLKFIIFHMVETLTPKIFLNLLIGETSSRCMVWNIQLKYSTEFSSSLEMTSY